MNKYVVSLISLIVSYFLLSYHLHIYVDPADIPIGKVYLFLILTLVFILLCIFLNKKIVKQKYYVKEEARFTENLLHCLIIFVFFSSYTFNEISAENKIKTNKEYLVTRGVKTADFIATKQGEKLYRYFFTLNNYRYEGRVGENELTIRKGNDQINLEDSIEILYYPKNPDINLFSDYLKK